MDLFSSENMWILKVILGVLALVLANTAIKRLMLFVHRGFLPISTTWRGKIEKIIYLPLHFMLWILGVAFFLNILKEHFGIAGLNEYVSRIRNVGLLCCFSWLLIRWKNEIQQLLLLRRKSENKLVDPAIFHILGRIGSIVIITLTVLFVLQILGLNILPLIAFGGVGAAALGFAGKDVIANFFGGLMLSITRPFTVGDMILLPDRHIEGHVEEIGWYLTSIRDKEKRPVYLPNAMFSTILVVNCSRMTHRRIEEKIAVRYEDLSKIQSIIDEIRKEISIQPSIDTALPILIAFKGFQEYFLEIYVDVYCLVTEWQEFLKIKQEILIRISQLLTSHGAEMPFPITTINFPEKFKL
jgi:MscS family membrane protein